ncbi:hypothetical protein ACFC09_22505 [Streptomyces sp. NPDC056161]|uniref:hypothetical protein n=1 Tax=Streptomyces sp. NPDC056161 TaxID=3345732 RepID=UPI0035DF996E
MSSARTLRSGRVRLRVLVLLLALLVPGAHAEAHATPIVVGDIVQHDGLDTALRPPSRAVHHPLAAAGPSPLADPPTAAPHAPPLPLPPRPPHALRARCSVVLRC